MIISFIFIALAIWLIVGVAKVTFKLLGAFILLIAVAGLLTMAGVAIPGL